MGPERVCATVVTAGYYNSFVHFRISDKDISLLCLSETYLKIVDTRSVIDFIKETHFYSLL